MSEYYPEIQTLIYEYATRQEAIGRIRELSGTDAWRAKRYLKDAGIQFPKRLAGKVVVE